MTNEQAATKLTNIMHDDHYAWHPSILEAFRMAVDALRGLPSAQLSFSQPHEKDAYYDGYDNGYNAVFEAGQRDVLMKDLPSAQPEQAVKDCRTCKHGKYNDYHDTYFCYNAEDCSNWDKWETSAQPDITLESAIDYLHSIGWIQEHDRILTESAQTEHNSDDERKIADLHKMVNYLLSRLESQWIPVSEGLPKEYGEYICTMENGQVQECGFVPENQRGLVDGWSTCEADGHKFLGYVDVLAWMPLPEPYAERK